MVKICVKILNNGQVYIDKDFINNFGVEQVAKYGYTIVEIDEKYIDCEPEDFNGLSFNLSKYENRKLKISNEETIQNNLRRMNELSKDFIQSYLGASIPNLDVKKQEFVRLHNEVRTLQGKEPRVYYLT